MAKKKAKRDKSSWDNICLRKTTIKRMKIIKAYMEVPTYDDIINEGLDLVEKENK